MKKQYWVLKGNYEGEPHMKNPFYSSVLDEKDFDSFYTGVEDPEVRQRMIEDLKKKMILMEEV